jgi:para-nitrobenzyl esterase
MERRDLLKSATSATVAVSNRRGRTLLAHPFDPAAPAVSAHVPMLIGANLHEFIHGVDAPEAGAFTKPELLRQLRAKHGAKAEAIAASLQREYPWAKPFDIRSIAGNRPRESAATQARRGARVRLPVRLADAHARRPPARVS